MRGTGSKRRRGLLGCARGLGRRLALPLGSERGFTLTEVLIVIVVSSGIVATVAVAYNATLRSWEGTAALADAQREGALAVEVMANGIRPGSVVIIGSQSDSIAVVLQRDVGDTVIASYFLDTLGNIHNASGTIIASGVDSLGFSTTDTLSLIHI